MRKSRFNEEQIIGILKESEAGVATPELNENWFFDLADARRKIAAWKWDYNYVRPHSALGYQTPMEFAAAWQEGFYSAGAGEGASNASPFPRTPIPATLRGEQNMEKVSLSLD